MGRGTLEGKTKLQLQEALCFANTKSNININSNIKMVTLDSSPKKEATNRW